MVILAKRALQNVTTNLIGAADDSSCEASRQRNEGRTGCIDPYVLVRDVVAGIVVDKEAAPYAVGVGDTYTEPAAVHITPRENRHFCAVPLLVSLFRIVARQKVLAAPKVACMVAGECYRRYTYDRRDVDVRVSLGVFAVVRNLRAMCLQA